MESYRTMSEMPAHGNATRARVANGVAPPMQPPRENFQMGADYAPGLAGGRYMEQRCYFPQPPPKRCYCMPAAFSSLDGRSYSRLLDAYGSSRICSSNY